MKYNRFYSEVGKLLYSISNIDGKINLNEKLALHAIVENEFITKINEKEQSELQRTLKVVCYVVARKTKAKYVTEVNQRLIIPQSLFKESNGISGWYRVGEEKSIGIG